MFNLIFDGQTTDGVSAEAEVSGGLLEVVATGNFGGGTVTIEAFYSAINEWVPIEGGTFTTSSVKLLQLIRPCSIRAVLAGATGANLKVGI